MTDSQSPTTVNAVASSIAMPSIFAALQSARLEADLPLHILADRRAAAMDDDVEEALALASEAKNPVARQRYLAMAAAAGSKEAKERLAELHRQEGLLAPCSDQVAAILARGKQANYGLYPVRRDYEEDDLVTLTRAAHAGNQTAQLALAEGSCCGINGDANPADACLWAKIARSGPDESLAAEAQQIIYRAYGWISKADRKELPDLVGYWEVAGEDMT